MESEAGAMTNSEKAMERYRNDPLFATIVDALTQQALEHELTPGELRDIAYVAALRVEQLVVRRMIVTDETNRPPYDRVREGFRGA
jgi:hypothetical protein